MKNYKPTISLAFTFLVITKVSTAQTISQPIIEVIKASEIHAKKEGLLSSAHEISSIAKFRTKWNGFVDKKRNDKYAVAFFEKLEGKIYWSVCFLKKDAQLGGTTCYFIDDKSHELLTMYRSK